jgi:hypothetical protein
MKTIFAIYSILLPFSDSQLKPNFCVDCRFYRKDFFSSSEFGKCALFPKKEEDSSFFVNGNTNDKIEYYFCSTARTSDHMCGKEGKYYEKK